MPAQFDCNRCEVRQHAAELWPENAEAWRLYGVVFSRVATECQLSSWVLEGFLGDLPGPARVAMVQRLDLIRETFAPLPRVADHEVAYG